MDNEKYYYVSVEYTKRYGIIKAAILSRIEFWCEYNEKNKIAERNYDGFWWSGYLTSKDLSSQLGISKKTIEKNISELVKHNIIFKAKYNKKHYDKTNWFRLNPLLPESITHSPNRGKVLLPERNGITLIEDNHYSERGKVFLQEGKPIPDNPDNPLKYTESTAVNPPVNHKNTAEEFEKQYILSLLEEKFEEGLVSILTTILTGGYLTKKTKDILNENRDVIVEKIPALDNYIKEYYENI